ncbi:MAG TPA: 4-(cytidine 5'-diphospho)-2-C-methyl-D-erythritol kinase [Pyrinomonadaceae bacterium]|nr:4-(cytidine 5'-diphospho)-2-C-methyl-D-erythritol kinase [Pyrinomonadaceae bacterium]
MNHSEISLRAFAKINLNLRVLGKRPDDYHEVWTVLQTVSLHDGLTFSRRSDDQVRLTCNDPEIPVDDSNLIVKAAQVLRKQAAVSFGADIHLLKRIPTQGGLGGASANAAVALLGLSQLWQLEVDISELCQLGKGLGADVAFFFHGGTAIAEGIGTDISTLPDLPAKSLIIVTPTTGVSTAAAYQALKAPSLTSQGSVSILASSFAEPSLGDCAQWPLHNDFEAVIFEIKPEIGRAKRALIKAGARGALMTGSGSSVFGIFDSEAARDRALSAVDPEAGWRIFPCQSLARDEYLKALGSSTYPLLRSFNMRSDTGA